MRRRTIVHLLFSALAGLLVSCSESGVRPTADGCPVGAQPGQAAVDGIDARDAGRDDGDRLLAELLRTWPKASQLAVHDHPAGRDGRWVRERLLRTAFKHPLIRVEDLLERPAKGAEPRLVQRREMVADHLMVSLKPGAQIADLAAAMQRIGASLRRPSRTGGPALVAFPPDAPGGMAAVQAALAADPAVRGVEPDGILRAIGTPDDPQFGSLWGLHNTGQGGGTADADIDAPEAWDISTGSRQVLVGVVDTGIDRDHPDLAANMWVNAGENGLDGDGADRRTNGLDDDGNGFVDDWRGWDFVNDDNDPQDDHYHGTHCAGTIGAVGGNGIGVAGVCWQVSLVGLKFLAAYGSGTTSDAIEAVRYADTIGCQVTSNSWGGGGFSQELKDAIEAGAAHGRLFVAAAGNSGGNNDLLPHYPAAYDSPNIIAVGASDRTDARAGFSCYGATSVDLFAPGVDILSTAPGGAYQTLNGTSMATPHVSGACALLLAVDPVLGPQRIKDALLATVDAKPAFAGFCASGGRLNLRAALAAVAGPRLTMQEVRLVDLGDGDGVIEQGEQARVEAILRSNGSETVLAATASFASADAQVTVLDGPAALGDLPPGRTATAAWRVAVAPGSLPHAAACTATVSASASGPWAFPIPVAVHQVSFLSGRVFRLSGGAPVAGAQIAVDGAAPSATSAVDGSWWTTVLDGSHQVTCTAPGFSPSTTTGVLTPPNRFVVFRLGAPVMSVAPTALAITVEQGGSASAALAIGNAGDLPLNWRAAASSTFSGLPEPVAEGLWHQTAYRRVAGPWSWYYGVEASRTYLTGAATRGALTFVDVPVEAGSRLEFQSWRQVLIGAPWESSQVGISSDGGATWQALAQITESDGQWRSRSIALGAYAGRSVWLKFSFENLIAFTPPGPEGWYLADIRLLAADGQTAALRADPGAGAAAPGATQATAITVRPGTVGSGTYAALAVIAGDDPARPSATVPVTITVLAAPALVLAGLDSRDGPPGTGDSDGMIEPGETVAVSLILRNAGGTACTAGAATAASASTYATVVQGEVAIPAIAAGASASAIGWATIAIDPTCPDGQLIPVRWTVRDGAGRGWSMSSGLVVVRRYGLSGTVTALGSGEPLAGVLVSAAGRSAISAADGSYAMNGLPAGSHAVTASLAGWTATGASLAVPPDAGWSPSLGWSALTASPGSLAFNVAAGDADTAVVELSNPGSLPLVWSAARQMVVTTSDLLGGPSYLWEDLRASGTALTLGDEQYSDPCAIGFPFPFYGADFASVRVCSNGWLSFTSTRSAFSLPPLPSTAAPADLIALLGRDLDPSRGGTVHWARPDADTFAVQFTDVPEWSNAASLLTAQVRLRRDGTVLCYYQRVDRSGNGVAGVQDGTCMRGAMASYHSAVAMHGGLAVRYAPAAWLAVSPAQGVVGPGATQAMTVAVDAARVSGGFWSGGVQMVSDASRAPIAVMLPVSLRVIGGHAPVAYPMALATSYGRACAFTPSGSDADGDPIGFGAASLPAHGAVTASQSQLVYAPARGFTGTDSFTMVASDGALVSDPVLVTVAVGPPPPGKLLLGDGVADELAGAAVACDGARAVLGAPGVGRGRAAVFRRDGNAWTEEAVLLPDAAGVETSFGSAVAVAGDTIVVLAGSTSARPLATVFTRIAGGWMRQQKIQGSATLVPAGTAEERAGGLVQMSIALDGDTLAIGAPGDGNGSIAIFRRQAGVWSEAGRLAAPAGIQRLGRSLALDGDDLVAGAYLSGANGQVEGGQACFFRRTAGAWALDAQMQAPAPAAYHHFGWSVALDAGMALIGAPRCDDGGSTSGAVFAFERRPAGWQLVQSLGNPGIGDPAAYDQFGRAVGLEGELALIGSPYRWKDGTGAIGGVWRFRRGPTGFVAESLWLPDDGWDGDWAGEEVSIAGGWAVVGAAQADDRGSEGGAAYAVRCNRRPTVAGASLTTAEDTFATFPLDALDPDGDTLTPIVVQAPAHGWLGFSGLQVLFTPDTDWNGSDVAVVAVTDGDLTSPGATIAISVAAVEDPPRIIQLTAAVLAISSWQVRVVADDDGGEAALSYDWSVVQAPAGGSATFAPDACHAASLSTAAFSRAGSYRLRVSVSDADGRTAAGEIGVVVDARCQAVAVDPAAAVLEAGGLLTLAARLTDQFGQPMDQGAVLWSLAPGSPGVILPGGIYQTAAGESGTAEIVASAGTASGSARIIVTPPARPAGGTPAGGGGGGGCGGGLATLLAAALLLLGSAARLVSRRRDGPGRS